VTWQACGYLTSPAVALAGSGLFDTWNFVVSKGEFPNSVPLPALTLSAVAASVSGSVRHVVLRNTWLGTALFIIITCHV